MQARLRTLGYMKDAVTGKVDKPTETALALFSKANSLDYDGGVIKADLQKLLFDKSEESPGAEGLGILRGEVLRIPDGADRKVPQIGWNDLSYPNRGRLFAGVPEGSYVYFVHSYYLRAEDPAIVTARTQYGVSIDASVERGSVYACQFHPEKSERVGMMILRNFLEL